MVRKQINPANVHALVSAERDIAELKRTLMQIDKQRKALDGGELKARARLALAESARAHALRQSLGPTAELTGIVLSGLEEYLNADDPATVSIEVVE